MTDAESRAKADHGRLRSSATGLLLLMVATLALACAGRSVDHTVVNEVPPDAGDAALVAMDPRDAGQVSGESGTADAGTDDDSDWVTPGSRSVSPDQPSTPCGLSETPIHIQCATGEWNRLGTPLCAAIEYCVTELNCQASGIDCDTCREQQSWIEADDVCVAGYHDIEELERDCIAFGSQFGCTF